MTFPKSNETKWSEIGKNSFLEKKIKQRNFTQLYHWLAHSSDYSFISLALFFSLEKKNYSLNIMVFNLDPQGLKHYAFLWHKSIIRKHEYTLFIHIHIYIWICHTNPFHTIQGTPVTSCLTRSNVVSVITNPLLYPYMLYPFFYGDYGLHLRGIDSVISLVLSISH